MIDGKRIIVSMTSWKKRIGNVPKVVFSLSKNSIKPDLIVCNLSLEEFPDKKIPEDLQVLADAGIVEIYWEEKNTTVFKKFIPTIKRFYGEDYFLFTVDDDELYSTEYIKVGIDALKTNKAAVIAIRGNETGVWGGRFCCHSSIFKPDYWEHITEDLISCRMNDPYTNRYLRHYNIKVFNVNKNLTSKFNDICSNRNVVGGYARQNVKVKRIIDEIWKSF